MDAQQMTFDHDPETVTADLEETREKDNECCCKSVVCCPFRLLYWYLAPITCELCHTLKCFVFHPLNFAVSMFLIHWDCITIPLGIGFIPLCLMGVPLLWVSIECIIAFSRFDLGFNYVMVENGKKFDKSRKHLLKLSLYSGNIPLCCCYNSDYSNCWGLMVDRMKYILTSIDIYKYLFYQIIIRSVITFGTFWIIFIVAVNFGLIGLPAWYLWNDSMFKENKVLIGWNNKCNYDKNDDLQCPQDYWWIINTFERALAVGISALFVFPLTLRINNWFAYINKIGAYKFYTNYYAKDLSLVNDKKPMLEDKTRFNSV